jgi:phosphatidylserine/phosphatidylglycerophosphate/cardiolipin synthase-like enzyme
MFLWLRLLLLPLDRVAFRDCVLAASFIIALAVLLVLTLITPSGMMFRNHRKILIVDDRVGFCGTLTTCL